jgi:two-component system, OmpR family, response regulator AdeR
MFMGIPPEIRMIALRETMTYRLCRTDVDVLARIRLSSQPFSVQFLYTPPSQLLPLQYTWPAYPEAMNGSSNSSAGANTGTNLMPEMAPMILIVEDEIDMAEIMELYLRRENYRTERLTNGARALETIRKVQPNLMLLDIQLPGMDGLEILRKVRATSNLPVIMVTARAEDIDKLIGLELGADDYIIKPLSPREVVARVKAVLRRTADRGSEPKLFQVGVLEVDPTKLLVRAYGTRLDLTMTEYRLIECLARNAGRVFSREELIQAALPDSDALERVVDQHLKNLRRKLEVAGLPEIIETVRGAGYRLWSE